MRECLQSAEVQTRPDIPSHLEDSRDDLEALLTDEAFFNAFLGSLDEVRAIETEHQDALKAGEQATGTRQFGR